MFEVRIYYKDTDAEGIVYYANYLRFIEMARTEYLRDHGFSVEDTAKEGIVFVVAQANIDYHSSAYHGDILQISTEIENLKRASFFFTHKIINKENQRLIASVKTKFACLSNGKPVPLPPAFKAFAKKD